ncbi:MAG: type B 50S ribosomal protein L31 [Pseudomonadota bacterium]
MKKEIHPDYGPVVFKDTSCGFAFLTRSTATSDATIEWEDGNTYPLINVEISSASHPVYTGEQRKTTSEGRIAQYQKRFGKKTDTKK